MTVFNTSATVVFLLCEISPKYEKLKKKKEYSIFPFKLKKIIKFREFVFHHICTSTCNWNVSGFY